MKRNHGIALITVLMVAGVMVILLGSFVRLNQHHFGILNNDLHHVAAVQAANSAFEYGLYQVERNRSWAGPPFQGEGDPSVEGFLDITLVEGTHTVKGKVLESGAEFEIEVLNNIDGAASRDGVHKGQCRFRISASRGASTVHREAILNTAPLFDGGVIASKNISIDAEKYLVSSSDPLRNRIRAKQRIDVPDYADGSLQFNPAAQATEKGVLWARNGIKSGGKDLDDIEVSQAATEKTGGQFLPHSDTHYDVYDLQLSEVRSSERSVNIDSGVYVFDRRAVSYTNTSGESVDIVVPVLERRDWALDDDGSVRGGDVRELWYMTSNLPDDAISDWVGLYGDLPDEGRHAVTGNSFALDKQPGADGETYVEVNFNSLDPVYRNTEGTSQQKPPSISLNSDVNLRVNGDFGIASADGTYFPTIRFEDPESGSTVADEGGRAVSGSITTHSSNGKPGSIYISGLIAGSGKLLAEGDVTVRNTYANVASDSTSDLSIFAGGSVTLRPQKARALDDQTIFQGGGADGTTRFRGLIFAREDVLIEADKDTDTSIVDKADVYIEGAVVARNGSVKIRQANEVNINYNPEYLDSILNPVREERVRLERVVWKEF